MRSSILPRRLSERLASVRRDVFALKERVAGRHPSPVVARRSRARAAEVLPIRRTPRAAIHPRPIRIARVVQETPDAFSLFVEEADGSPISFRAGEFLSFDVEVDGVVLRRAYSLASAAVEGHAPHVTIKRIPDGRVSNALAERIAGDVLPALGPSGELGACLREGIPSELVLIAGGSGITPLIAIAETALRTSGARVVLLYGSRDEASVIFRARLDALTAEFDGRFEVSHVLEQEQGARLDPDTLRARLDAHAPFDESAHYFVCGPSPVLDSANVVLADVAPERLHEERFISPADRPTGRSAASEPVALTVRRAGVDVAITTDGETLLEAGLRAGVDMPFSCAMGGCAACKCKVVTGSVVMDEPNCLTRKEREAGYVLACISRAAEPCTIEVE